MHGLWLPSSPDSENAHKDGVGFFLFVLFEALDLEKA